MRLKQGLRFVAADGYRSAGFTDGRVWRDPSPHDSVFMLSVLGRRTRPWACEVCRGLVVEYVEGDRFCTRPVRDGGCGRWWKEEPGDIEEMIADPRRPEVRAPEPRPLRLRDRKRAETEPR